jgi:drug/metabolite transporter (DMT)-like permease
MVLWAVLPFALGLLLQSLDPVTVTWARFVLAGATLACWLGARGELPKLRALGGSGARLLTVAVVGLALNYVTYLAGLGHTTPASAPLLNQLSPLLLSLGGLVVFGERFSRLQWIGFGILIGGLVLFSAAQLSELAAGADRYRLGIALLTFGSFAWAAYALAQKQLLLRLPTQPLMLLIYAGCAIFLTPFAQPRTLAALDATGVGLLLFCAANTLLAYGAFAASLAHWEASRVSAVLACAPLVTLAIAALSLGGLPPERLTPASWLGALCVVGGSIATSTGARRAG